MTGASTKAKAGKNRRVISGNLLAALGVAVALVVLPIFDRPGVVKSMDNASQHQNRLANQSSPYLLQHANNPVDWYPWGDEAFEKARLEDKPIFLSIGYSTCHWCHVMEHESFEDEQVAKRLNEVFICVKVDREERPDIDNVYMQVCQAMTGSGGWPLTILMTAEKKPFFAGTYFPKHSQHGRVGMLDLIAKVKETWDNDRAKITASANKISAAFSESSASGKAGEIDKQIFNNGYNILAKMFDPVFGGFGYQPKFPTPHNLTFLLRHYKRSGDEAALAAVETTLQSMRRGGIYDHVGFGFHRYSTDKKWLVPHFEKMLYDQALLINAYVEAYQATHKEQYADVAREILTYVKRDMTDPGGGFYSAEDADSEGEEGKFYLWTKDELTGTLDEKQLELVTKVFNVNETGNYHDEASGLYTGKNILHLQNPLSVIATELNISEAELVKQIETVREILFTCRKKRIHPLKDDKILTSWNGLMIAASAKAARILNDQQYAQSATAAADFILANCRDKSGRLLRRYRQGSAAIDAVVDDYAFLTWGLLEIYQVNFEVKYLQAALDLNRQMLDLFWDDQDGGLYFTADHAEKLLFRQKEIYDGALPSGNSVALLNQLRLARITGDPKLADQASKLTSTFAKAVNRNPASHTQMLIALDFIEGPAREIVIAAPSGDATAKKMLQAINREFLPNKVIVFRPTDAKNPPITKIAPYTKNQTAIDNKATAYICSNYQCSEPVTEIAEIKKLLVESSD